MDDEEMLIKVKNALGIQGEYQDDTLAEYINEVVEFLTDAGITQDYINAGLVARGVSDLWNYGASNGKLSDYFIKRAAQLSYKS